METESLKIVSDVIKKLHSTNPNFSIFREIEDFLFDLCDDPSEIANCYLQKAKHIASFMINPIDKIWKFENASELLNSKPIRIAQWSFIKSVLCQIWSPDTKNRSRLELLKLFNIIVE